MTVSVVIPVWNDVRGAEAAVAKLTEFDCIAEIIVVDDCSNEPVEANLDLQAAFARGIGVKFLHLDENKGGGAARNAGLAIVTCPYVIFLDSDDLPTEQYGEILESFLAYDGPFDFGMFRHIDSRERAKGIEQGLPIDERFWQLLPKAAGAQKMQAAALENMVSVSAYPWNKLYRTAFLRENNIRCTEIPIHNDVEIHWVSFLLAENVLYSHEPGLVHFVNDTGKRITNRRDADRLRVFEALNNVQNVLQSSQASTGMLLAFWTFYCKLMIWISGNIDQEHVPSFQDANVRFIFENISKAKFQLVSVEDPALSNRILNHVKEV